MVKVLIVDDQPELRHVLQICLQAAGVEVLEAGNGDQAVSVIKEHNPEIIFLDVMMPGRNGFELCSHIRDQAHCSGTYIIMLSAKTDTGHRVSGLESGADAYLTKPFQPDEIMAQLKVGLRAVENRKSYLEDPLTGIFGRRAFDALFERTVARSHRHGTPLSMAMIDIDNFKAINDAHGHHTGDNVIKDTARVLQDQARESDLYFRWGGEEFVWLMPDTDAKGAITSAERFRRCVSEKSFEPAGPVTVSVGIATLRSGDKAIDFSHKADEALYRAKQAGRNQVAGEAGIALAAVNE